MEPLHGREGVAILALPDTCNVSFNPVVECSCCKPAHLNKWSHFQLASDGTPEVDLIIVDPVIVAMAVLAPVMVVVAKAPGDLSPTTLNMVDNDLNTLQKTGVSCGINVSIVLLHCLS